MLYKWEKDGRYYYDIPRYQNEDDLQTICDLLSKEYTIEILDKLLGPGTTIWYLRINGNGVSLVNGSYGNHFYPPKYDAILFFAEEGSKIGALLS